MRRGGWSRSLMMGGSWWEEGSKGSYARGARDIVAGSSGLATGGATEDMMTERIGQVLPRVATVDEAEVCGSKMCGREAEGLATADRKLGGGMRCRCSARRKRGRAASTLQPVPIPGTWELG